MVSKYDLDGSYTIVVTPCTMSCSSLVNCVQISQFLVCRMWLLHAGTNLLFLRGSYRSCLFLELLIMRVMYA